MQRQGSVPDEVVEMEVEDERERECVCMYVCLLNDLNLLGHNSNMSTLH